MTAEVAERGRDVAGWVEELTPPAAERDAYKVHVYRGLAERARHEARWARQGIALVDALEAASPDESPSEQPSEQPGEPRSELGESSTRSQAHRH